MVFLTGARAGRRAVAMFYQAVVLKSGDVVGGRLDAQDQSEFVVDLDRGSPICFTSGLMGPIILGQLSVRRVALDSC